MRSVNGVIQAVLMLTVLVHLLFPCSVYCACPFCSAHHLLMNTDLHPQAEQSRNESNVPLVQFCNIVLCLFDCFACW